MESWQWSVLTTNPGGQSPKEREKPITIRVQELLDRSEVDGLEVFAVVPCGDEVLVVRRRQLQSKGTAGFAVSERTPAPGRSPEVTE
jgi:hypothetical protein